MAVDFYTLKSKTSQVVKNQDSLKDSAVSALEQKVEEKLKEKEHKARSWLTISFLVGLFLLIILSGFYVIWYNNDVVDLAIKAKSAGIELGKDDFSFLSFETTFSLIFNSFGTSLGFIIGYYFKEKLGK